MSKRLIAYLHVEAPVVPVVWVVPLALVGNWADENRHTTTVAIPGRLFVFHVVLLNKFLHYHGLLGSRGTFGQAWGFVISPTSTIQNRDDHRARRLIHNHRNRRRRWCHGSMHISQCSLLEVAVIVIMPRPDSNRSRSEKTAFTTLVHITPFKELAMAPIP